jgi:head-tail adaptor
MLSADEIAAMRATATASLPETIEVQRATRAADGAGGSTVSWQAVATYPARLAPAGGEDEREFAGRVAGRSLWRITLPAEADVRLDDRVAVGGRTFEVLGVRARSFELCRVVLATLLE